MPNPSSSHNYFPRVPFFYYHLLGSYDFNARISKDTNIQPSAASERPISDSVQHLRLSQKLQGCLHPGSWKLLCHISHLTTRDYHSMRKFQLSHKACTPLSRERQRWTGRDTGRSQPRLCCSGSGLRDFSLPATDWTRATSQIHDPKPT